MTKNNFQTQVLESEKPTVLKFSAEWCAPCKILAPIVNEVAKELDGAVNFFEVDIDDEMELASSFKIKSVPTLMIFKDGKVVATQVGSLPKDKILKLITDTIK